MRLLSRAELRNILTKVLPNANSKDARDAVGIDLPLKMLPSGEIIPAVRLNFVRIQAKNEKGTVQWRWAYKGPLPYIDEEIVIDQKEKIILEPSMEAKGILL